ncbi:MAG: hypothetical protein PHQ27_00915 [Victivallales bacterium]|nr:hypothetical protein [Victivallales bacterium]
MKIISWNCNGAFRNKYLMLDDFDADILVIQECESPEFSTATYREWAGEYLWIGNNKNKGLGIFPRKNNSIAALNWNKSFAISGISSSSPSLKWKSEDLHYFLPCTVNNKILLLGVWTKENGSSFGYIGQFWKYLQIHGEDLNRSNTMICGDFNSNSIWDTPDRWWNHSDVVKELDEIGIHSLYHQQTGETQGKEIQKTFFLHHNIAKSYHIDYAFLSNDLLKRYSIEIGSRDIFLKHSDHLPLVMLENT